MRGSLRRIPSRGDSTVKHFRIIAVASLLAATVMPAAADDISGAGATFPYPIYAKWADAYKKKLASD
jgi:ABC-type phosphate transport system substrate-binding protein